MTKQKGGGPEAAICQEIAAWLRGQRWLVRVASYHQRMPRGLVGIGDILAWKGDHNLVIEVKRPGGARRVSQVDFWLALRAACPSGQHVIYILAESLVFVQDELAHRALIEDPREENT